MRFSGSLAVSPNAFTTIVLTNTDGTLSTNQVSTLGVLWYSLPAPMATDLAAVCAFSNSFFLAGASATMLRSANGTNWSTVSVSAAAGTTDLSGLAASTNLIVAVGDQAGERAVQLDAPGDGLRQISLHFVGAGFVAGQGENGGGVQNGRVSHRRAPWPCR